MVIEMKKRLILIAAICLAAVLLALPAAAEGEITGTCGDGVTWEYVTATDTLMISGSGEITDPTWFEYEEYDIAANALTLFLNNNNGSLTEIANGAFKDFEKLERVTLPDSITYIGDNAFAGCRSLVYVGFEGTLDQWGKVEIGSGNDAILTSKPMPYGNCGDGVTWKYSEASKTLTISGNGVISDTPGFVAFCEKLVINEGITAIGNWIFASSISQLNELVLPSSLKSIGDNAFAECTNLNTVVIPGSVENIGASAFRNCNITSLTIGDGCKTIGAYAFQNSAISKLELPESIETIAAGAFSGCSKLETV